MSEVTREMPKYVSHKEVWALKIKSVDLNFDENSGTVVSINITPEDDGYASFSIDEAYFNKHEPVSGGYYVVYKDGYKSFSPAEAFESGYTAI